MLYNTSYLYLQNTDKLIMTIIVNMLYFSGIKLTFFKVFK